MPSSVLKDMRTRMQSSIDALGRDFSGLRTGRASTALLDPIMVNAYGSSTPLSQVGTISAPEARMLSVQVWDKTMAPLVEKAIRESELGLNPMAEGQVIRIPLPDLSKERRQEMVKIAKKYAEGARVSIRNIRRDGMDTLKKMEKDNDISEDEQHKFGAEIQTITDDFISNVDVTLASKETDILHV